MAYLLDADGNRRFWPVLCTKIDIDWLRENRNQLFAEAKHIYHSHIWSSNEPWGEKLFLEGEALEMSRSQQKMRLNTDEVLEEVIERYLVGKDSTTMSDIILNCIGHKITDTNTRAQQIVVGRILKRLGFEKRDRSIKDKERYSYIRQVVVSQNYNEESE